MKVSREKSWEIVSSKTLGKTWGNFSVSKYGWHVVRRDWEYGERRSQVGSVGWTARSRRHHGYFRGRLPEAVYQVLRLPMGLMELSAYGAVVLWKNIIV